MWKVILGLDQGIRQGKGRFWGEPFGSIPKNNNLGVERSKDFSRFITNFYYKPSFDLKKKTSLADIAKALGVSKTLVSMVLNGKGDDNGINEDTQKRVWAKARELNYKPNIMARSLRTGRSQTIGLIVADISNAFYAEMCRAVEDAASKRGYNVLFGSSDEKADKEQQLIQMLRDRLVDGIILSTTLQNNEDIKELKEDGYPLVLIDRFIPGEDTPFVTADNYQGSKEAVELLVSKGLQRIACLKISPSHLTSITERVRGYRDALEGAGLSYDESLVLEIPYDSIEASIQEKVPPLLRGKEPIQGLFALNNSLATAFLKAVQATDLQIPKDISVVSFDDIELFDLYQPTITAVRQPVREMGTQAVGILLDKIEKKDKASLPDQVILPTELRQRESC